MKSNWRTPGQNVGENSPVTQVSWNDAVAFCNWLSEQEKREPSYMPDGVSWMLVAQPQGYRLPTEAEWEYACRVGTTTQYSFGDDWKEHDKFGWSNTKANGRPRGVGHLPANPFGLYDMHGNVSECCHDWHDGKWYAQSPSDDPRGPLRASSRRVYRGGSWYEAPANGRSSYRHRSTAPATHSSNRGFRIASSSIGAQPTTASVTTSTPPVVTPPPVSISKDAPRTLEFRLVGETLTLTLNDSVVITAKDDTRSEGLFAVAATKGVLIQKTEVQRLDDPTGGGPKP